MIERIGPLAGESIPQYGGLPGAAGCNGCIDCCHLPEISITDEEAERLETMYAGFTEPLGELYITPDSNHEGWQVMRGPCVFRQYDRPLAKGGCRIYDDRPAGCAIFTCDLLLRLRREKP